MLCRYLNKPVQHSTERTPAPHSRDPAPHSRDPALHSRDPALHSRAPALHGPVQVLNSRASHQVSNTLGETLYYPIIPRQS